MGDDGPKGELGEKVCSLPSIVFVYVLESTQRSVWKLAADVAKVKRHQL